MSTVTRISADSTDRRTRPRNVAPGLTAGSLLCREAEWPSVAGFSAFAPTRGLFRTPVRPRHARGAPRTHRNREETGARKHIQILALLPEQRGRSQCVPRESRESTAASGILSGRTTVASRMPCRTLSSNHRNAGLVLSDR